jgi:hypothetical protein
MENERPMAAERLPGPKAPLIYQQNMVICSRPGRVAPMWRAADNRRYAHFEPLGHTLFVTLRHSGNGARSDRAADWSMGIRGSLAR